MYAGASWWDGGLVFLFFLLHGIGVLLEGALLARAPRTRTLFAWFWMIISVFPLYHGIFMAYDELARHPQA